MRIAVWQDRSPLGDTEAALGRLASALAGAGAMGAAVLVAPEVYLPGYNRPDIPAKALARDGEVVRRLSEACRAAGCGLVVGYAERDGLASATARWRSTPKGARSPTTARSSSTGRGRRRSMPRARAMRCST